jgi:hypothetical protein
MCSCRKRRLEVHKWVPLLTPLPGSKQRGVRAAATPEAGTPPPAKPGGEEDDQSAGASGSSGQQQSGGSGGGGGGGTAGGSEAVGGGKPSDGGGPPYMLMEHLPLAIFTNGVLTALNEARQCALQGCAKQAAE